MNYIKDDLGFGNGGCVLLPQCDYQVPTVYLYHGTGGYDEWFSQVHIDTVISQLVTGGSVSPVAIVLPQIKKIKDDESQSDPFFKLYSENIIPQLISFVEEKYSNQLLKGYENRAIGGFSMGGAAALLYAIKFKKTFYHVGAFSPGPVIYVSTKREEKRTTWIKDAKDMILETNSNAVNFIGYGSCESNDFIDTAQDCIEAFKENGVTIYGDGADIVLGTAHDFYTFNPLIEDFFKIDFFKNNHK